ncbi:MAG: radical SAM protein [Candidatus Eisenbacteria bacterium]|uniref:Radical SAM protein n=1 Tax=Eiseniibacteriota bacterium TaxID=2212470 RepID=A0A7Y2H2S2_UNCEI|nr:radical SAM protein [Candidatus Eisenbacteria bacterium]
MSEISDPQKPGAASGFSGDRPASAEATGGPKDASKPETIRSVAPGVPQKPLPKWANQNGQSNGNGTNGNGNGHEDQHGDMEVLFPHARAHRRMVPEDLLLVLTYRCNSRCVMCGIWEADQSGKGELTADEYAKILPDSLLYVNLSGGEAFLRKDLPQVVEAVRSAAPKAKVTLSTNGLQPRQTKKLLPDILKHDPGIGFAISIDGEEEMHDKVRGIKGGYAKAYETVKILQAEGVTNLRIAFTATVNTAGDNTDHLSKIYDLAMKTGVEFTVAVAHNSDHYFKTAANKGVNTEELTRQLNYVAQKELQSTRPKSWLRAYFHHGLVEHARANVRPTPCEAGHTSFMIDPTGDVFPCNILDMPVGNVREHSFMDIWKSEEMEKARGVVRACNQPCWMVCTARASMRRDRYQVMGWVAKNKVKSHFGSDIIE